jgi:hypothetical protein
MERTAFFLHRNVAHRTRPDLFLFLFWMAGSCGPAPRILCGPDAILPRTWLLIIPCRLPEQTASTRRMLISLDLQRAVMRGAQLGACAGQAQLPVHAELSSVHANQRAFFSEHLLAEFDCRRFVTRFAPSLRRSFSLSWHLFVSHRWASLTQLLH